MFDPENNLRFRGISKKDQLNEVSKPSNLVKLTNEEKIFISKCKLSRYFTSNKVMHRDLEIIYNRVITILK